MISSRALGHLFFDALQPGRERVHSRHAVVDAVARVKTAQRRVREIPFPGIKAKALVDHSRFVARHRLLRGFARVAQKKPSGGRCCCTSICRNQHPGEVMQVFHLAQSLVGKKVVQRELPGISGIAGAELQPGLDGIRARGSSTASSGFSRINSSETVTISTGTVGRPRRAASWFQAVH